MEGRRRLSSSLAALAAAATIATAGCGPKPKAVVPSKEPPPPAVNPFAGAEIYGSPKFKRSLEDVAGRHPEEAPLLRKVAEFPAAVWLDTIAQAGKVSDWLEDAAKKSAGGKPQVPVFVVYDLPNRDCAAEASNGELKVVENGEFRYQSEYIDPIAAAFKAHPNQKIAVILEPDSLGNMVTNLDQEKCAAAAEVYKRSVAYAIATLSLPNVFIYVDAAHAGWLGWPKNLPKAAQIFKEVLAMAGGPDRVRGFALNVSNYNPAVSDAKKNTPQEPAPDEVRYAGELADALAKVGITGKGFVIDTSRNGKENLRTAPGNWCNIKGAGLGERPRVAPAPNVDAFLWIKTPGESDGVADPKAPRFDQNCASDDAAPGAPQAGELFESFLVDLVKNANPPVKP